MVLEIMERISAGVGRHFLWCVIGFSALAFFIPAPFTRITPWVTYLLGVIMLGMGMTLTPADFKKVVRRPRDISIGVAAQFLIMPALGWLIALALNLPPDLAAGLVLVGSCPSGTASNVMAYLGKGDVALSVSITSLTTLMAPVMTPALTLWLAGQWVPVPADRLLVEILKIVVFPVIAGLILRMAFPERVERGLRVFPLLSAAAIIAIITAIVGVNAERLLTVGPLVFLAVILHNLSGFTLGFLASRFFGMAPPKVRTVTYEVGMQNSGLGATLALTYFAPAAAIPAAIFSVWQNIVASALVSYWVRRG